MQTDRFARTLAILLLAGSSVAACGGPAATPSPTAASVTPAGSAPASPAATPAGPTNTVAINAGGPAVGDFRADQYFTGGATYGSGATVDVSQISVNAPPTPVFGTERYGAMKYVIPDRSGPQTVSLYFVESYVTGPGERVFGVLLNGAQVLRDFDIYAAAGGPNKAVVQTFQTAADAGGAVTIEFVPDVENPKINAIVVSGAGTTATPVPPTPAPTPAAPPTNSPDAKGSAGCGKPRTLANGTVDIQSDGTRSYILRAPDNYDPNHPYRLVLAFHWAGGTAEQVASGTGATESPFYGLWDRANNSTIFVAPTGLGSGNETGWPNVSGQDVAFADAILAQVKAGLCIDTTRVFATGFSYGAAMSFALACARPDVFRGVVLFSGAELSGCAGGTRPIAFFASHGLADSVLDISQARLMRDQFLKVNGLMPQDPPEPAAGSGTHVCTTYRDGSGRYPVEWCAFDGDHSPNPHDTGQAASWTPAEAWAFIDQF